jgi:hypothetical protein
MKKAAVLTVILGLALFGATVASAQLPRGESAIFLKDGQMIIDHVISFSLDKPIVRTRNQEFNLRDLWMINFDEERWDYPEERQSMDQGVQYLFLRDGNIIAGQIVSFRKKDDVRRGTPWGFAVKNGAGVVAYPDPNIRRVYFSKAVPQAFRNQGQGQNQGQQQNDNPIVGRYSSIGNSAALDLQLLANGTARWTAPKGGVIQGTWGFNRGDTSIVVIRLNGQVGGAEMTFGRDGNDLVGLNYDKRAFGQLRFRKSGNAASNRINKR